MPEQLWDELAPLLRCPVCGEALHREGRTITCPARHSFDLSRQGHLNLLGRAAPQHADTAEMVAARERFFSQGHYHPLSTAICELVPDDARVLLDVGAGPGQHLAFVLDRRPGAVGLATDISVPAARRAAKSHDRMASLVTDTWAALPLQDGSLDVVLCTFAPRNAAEFARVLRPGGAVVVAAPRPEHLAGLRRELGLLGIHEHKDDQLLRQFAEFGLDGHHEVTTQLDLTADQIADLVAMGPNAHHQTERAQVGATVTIAVDVRRFVR